MGDIQIVEFCNHRARVFYGSDFFVVLTDQVINYKRYKIVSQTIGKASD